MSEIWIGGAWYDGGLPTNSACGPGVGGTAGGEPCWFNNGYNGSATPIVNEFSPFVVDKNPATSLYQYLSSRRPRVCGLITGRRPPATAPPTTPRTSAGKTSHRLPTTPSALCNYFGFIDGDTSPALSAGNNYGETAWSDLEPIIWPAKGYVDGSGDPASRGVRHPFLFQPGDGFLYLYYLDTTPGSWGIKVARSPDRALGAAGSRTNYDAADGQWDLPSVPKGLSISNYNDYLSTDGPPASNLWGDDGPDTVPMTFRVARLTGLPGYRYIGMEESVGVATSTTATPYPYTGVTAACPAIRLSSDLVHWTPPQCIPTDTASSDVGWYPVLLSSDGSTDQTVAASGFYVVSGQDSTAYIQPVKIAPASAR